MSVDDQLPAIVQSVDTRLRTSLAKARKIKQTPNIESPLQATDFEESATISAPPTDAEHLGNPALSHTAFETAARNIFYELLFSYSINEPDFVEVWNLLDLIQICADHKQCDPSLALWLIEELLDSQTINGCRRVFDYLESRRERLITKAFSTNKQMIMLRSCNELLRRLSRAEDAVFCGRVFIFLFQSFPLGDKSSVNLRGEFHVENTTLFDAPPPKAELVEESADAMEVDEQRTEADAAASGATNSTTMPGEEDGAVSTTADATPKPVTVDATKKELKKEDVDMDALYTTFWSLQDVFSNPKKVFSEADFESFKSGLDITLKQFKNVPKVLQAQSKSRNSDSNSRGTKRKRGNGDDYDDFASTFNPKYLTSRDLFELEMSDLTFQRHILVQALILIDFLLSLTPKAKKRLADFNAQRAMIYDYILSDDDAKWANSTRTTIATYLQSLPGGNFHHRMVSTILARDKNWVKWKAESCPAISRPPVLTESLTDATDVSKRVTANKRLKSLPMGAIEVDYLSDSFDKGDGRLEQLKKNKTATEAMDELAADEDEKLRQKERLKTYVHEIENIDLNLEMAPTLARYSHDELQRLSAAEKKEYEAKKEEHEKLFSGRSTCTWKTIRLATEYRMGVLGKIDESKTESIKVVLKDEDSRAAANTTNSVKSSSTAINAEGSSENEAREDAETEGTAEEQTEQMDRDYGGGGNDGSDAVMADANDVEAEMKVEVEAAVTPSASFTLDSTAASGQDVASTLGDEEVDDIAGARDDTGIGAEGDDYDDDRVGDGDEVLVPATQEEEEKQEGVMHDANEPLGTE